MLYPHESITQRELSFLLLLWGLSDPRIAELCEMPRCFGIKLHSETQVSGRLGMSGGRSPRHAQNPLSGERRKTLSITHHALSPHLICTPFNLINWLQRFYRITMSLKRPFVPKSDVKQWFTTTTTSHTVLVSIGVLVIPGCFTAHSVGQYLGISHYWADMACLVSAGRI